MTPTTPARERTRREIEQQAMALFVSRGYDSTSLQDIATAAGCSKATVLYHFNGKPAVLAAVMEPSRIALHELVTAAAKLPAAEAQEFTLTGFVDLAVQFRGLLNVVQDLFATIEQYPELAGLIADGLRMTELLAGRTDDRLEVDLVKFAINGLLGECRHPGERTDAELHTLCDTALRRILLLNP
jgi:AcrR family transcriptional regulator